MSCHSVAVDFPLVRQQGDQASKTSHISDRRAAFPRPMNVEFGATALEFLLTGLDK